MIFKGNKYKKNKKNKKYTLHPSHDKHYTINSFLNIFLYNFSYNILKPTKALSTKLKNKYW
jgi:hypothetical protein